MEYGSIPGVSIPVSRLVQGTVPLDANDRERSFALLDGVLESGGTMFDTARHYGGGREELFGEWVASRGVRDRIAVLGKGAHHSPERRRVTPEDITDDLETSLTAFGFDFIDLYLLHRDDPAVPVGPIVERLAQHQREGKIGGYGGSNWSHERIAEANAYAAEHGLPAFAASSPNFSLATWVQPPWPECVSISGAAGKPAREWYAESGMPVIPWSSLAGGWFSGRFRRDNLDSFTDYYERNCAESYGQESNFAILDRVAVLGERYGLTLAQIALAYVLSTPVNVFALTGCRTPAEFAENAAAVGVRLTPDEVIWLEQGDPA
ncbi:MAG: aldo/keto reductase [Thermomicrobiales bacterium]|nr:aldo/keto reductase [Thermomicrobiales bacterium]